MKKLTLTLMTALAISGCKNSSVTIDPEKTNQPAPTIPLADGGSSGGSSSGGSTISIPSGGGTSGIALPTAESELTSILDWIHSVEEVRNDGSGTITQYTGYGIVFRKYVLPNGSFAEEYFKIDKVEFFDYPSKIYKVDMTPYGGEQVKTQLKFMCDTYQKTIDLDFDDTCQIQWGTPDLINDGFHLRHVDYAAPEKRGFGTAFIPEETPPDDITPPGGGMGYGAGLAL
tara:strand:+ start:394 stop:1080 length:687 start_codon:yes stop_codon:yes gene_type:complete